MLVNEYMHVYNSEVVQLIDSKTVVRLCACVYMYVYVCVPSLNFVALSFTPSTFIYTLANVDVSTLLITVYTVFHIGEMMEPHKQ